MSFQQAVSFLPNTTESELVPAHARRRPSQYVTATEYKELAVQDGNKSRRKFWLIGIAVGIVAIVALAVGLGVGLNKSRNSSSSAASSTAVGVAPSVAEPTSTFSAARNVTYWKPAVGTTWQIVLWDVLEDTSFDAQVFNIDLFTNEVSTITKLHSLGRKVICYFSAGSYENFRPDSTRFLKADYSKGLKGWPGEYWVNTSSPNVRNIMLSRLDLALAKGCDGVDPDNIDGFDNDTGFKLTNVTAIDYLTFLASAAHARGLSIGLKNGGAIAKQTVDMMQWEINEQCEVYNECSDFQPFIAAGKPVFHIEYPDSAPTVDPVTKSTICGDNTTVGFSTLIKKMKLDEWALPC